MEQKNHKKIRFPKQYPDLDSYGMIHLDTILRLGQQDLKKALGEVLLEMGYVPVSRKGFLYASGQVPVLLVAHLDTVHPSAPEIICHFMNRRYWISPQGIGGDDRAGVYMILQILQKVNCHVLFCEDEENGRRGAEAFTRTDINLDINYIVELDRKGRNDAVYYGCSNGKFQEFVAEFGFRNKRGTFSDISTLAPYLETAAVNLSAGFFHAHKKYEMIDTHVMAVNTERVIEMVMTPTEHFLFRAEL